MTHFRLHDEDNGKAFQDSTYLTDVPTTLVDPFVFVKLEGLQIK